MHLSFWELETYFRNIDFTIVGSGIVGLSTAYHLRLKHPNAKIIILEKGMLPEGASTKNAGFACFGTLSEILWYLESNAEEDVYKLVERRVKGLQKLRSLIPDEKMNYYQYGGFEIFRETDKELMDKSLENLDRINSWLHPIFQENVFRKATKSFGFKDTIGMIETDFEGHIHTGKMMKNFMKLVVSNDVSILNNVEVVNLNDTKQEVQIELKNGFQFKSKKVLLCTNAFTSKLYDLDVVPARAQVLVTKPIENLPFKGCFHMDEGFYYFRNVGNRVLFGGGRNLDLEGETTTEFATTTLIQNQLETYLREIILPNHTFEIDHRWSGIMGMGSKRNPIVKQLSNNVFCGVRLTGTGIAIGSIVGEELADLLD
ncbi:FAD-binding oxidoreductase [Flavobacterium sp. CBA20B-1]|uniref:NAD(P)/FAD-dependent oxidoreductase n=1 Tax=unclassified Flavobacterium TaxID=196869 RepID=UPI002224E839|nr:MULTISPECIES: FAD-dependent oxidoreductase [unclassified Flavobacterium]WCM42465.1 FAD-binding oxidoreductase [Flavobacterium sp. CBA20B-1]